MIGPLVGTLASVLSVEIPIYGLECYASQGRHVYNSRTTTIFMIRSFPDSRSVYTSQFTDHAKPLPDPVNLY